MNIKATVEAIKQQDVADAQAEFQRVKDVLHLAELATKAQAYADAVARRATEISTILDDTAIAAADRMVLEEKRPGLSVWFDPVEEKRKDLSDLTFGVQSRLMRALARYAALTSADLVLPPHELPVLMPQGEFPPVFAGLHRTLGNIRPLVDIDEAIKNLKDAFAELSERLNASVQ